MRGIVATDAGGARDGDAICSTDLPGNPKQHRTDERVTCPL